MLAGEQGGNLKAQQSLQQLQFCKHRTKKRTILMLIYPNKTTNSWVCVKWNYTDVAPESNFMCTEFYQVEPSKNLYRTHKLFRVPAASIIRGFNPRQRFRCIWILLGWWGMCMRCNRGTLYSRCWNLFSTLFNLQSRTRKQRCTGNIIILVISELFHVHVSGTQILEK